MNQIMLDLPQYGPWLVVPKGDDSCRRLADRHYSRQTVGAPQFTRPGHNLVLRTALGDAVWVTWSGVRDDGLRAWECTIFRNESARLSSDMIRAAVAATQAEWGGHRRTALSPTWMLARFAASTLGSASRRRAGGRSDGASGAGWSFCSTNHEGGEGSATRAA